MTDLKFRPLVDEAVELGLALAQPPPQLPVRAAQLLVLAAHLTHTQHQKLEVCVRNYESNPTRIEIWKSLESNPDRLKSKLKTCRFVKDSEGRWLTLQKKIIN